MARHLEWNNCLNVRDLGGLTTRSGSQTKWKRLVRADTLDLLTPDGLQELNRYGVKTIIDLRNEREVGCDRLPPPDGVSRLHVPLEDQSDETFWKEWKDYNCTPLYYKPFLKHSPQGVAKVFSAISQAPEGAIVFHCRKGRDRTGLIALMLLALAGVRHDEIAADYELSAGFLASACSPKETQHIAQTLAAHKTSLTALITEVVQVFDFEDYLYDAGLERKAIARVQARMLD